MRFGLLKMMLKIADTAPLRRRQSAGLSAPSFLFLIKK